MRNNINKKSCYPLLSSSVVVSHTIIIHFFRDTMNFSPRIDINRRKNLFDSPTLVHFINKTLQTEEYPRMATTRKLNNINEQKRFTSGVIQLSLITSDNHLSLKSKLNCFLNQLKYFLVFQFYKSKVFKQIHQVFLLK